MAWLTWGTDELGRAMGPRNPFEVIDIQRTDLDHGVRRAAITYPDGVEVELRIKLPAGPRALEIAWGQVPARAELIGAHTDEGDDGNVYTFASYWIPERLRCGGCRHAFRGNTGICKLVEA